MPNPTDRRPYHRWRNMMRRCYDPKNAGYVNYGGRGITVCERWHAFKNYYADVGDAPAGKSLDRIDNDGNYEPDNVRWADRSTQAKNRRKTSSAVAQSERTHCPKGHPYDETNTYRHRNHRYCRTCNTEGAKRRRTERRQNA